MPTAKPQSRFPIFVTPKMDRHPMRAAAEPTRFERRAASAASRRPASTSEVRAEFRRRFPAHPANFYAPNPPPGPRVDALLAASTLPTGSARPGYRGRVRLLRAMANPPKPKPNPPKPEPPDDDRAAHPA